MWSIHEMGVLAAQLVRMFEVCICVGQGAAGVVPTHLVCPGLEGWLGATSVCVSPAGVEVAHEERLVSRVALMFVDFPHDEVLDVAEWVGLV